MRRRARRKITESDPNAPDITLERLTISKNKSIFTKNEAGGYGSGAVQSASFL
jgi:hypothetical protein